MAADSAPVESLPLLHAILNLSKFHREHEKFYASSPREAAVTLQRHARSLQALADQWTITEPSARASLSPFEGAEDLNSAAAIQLDGVLFMEGEGCPAELARLIRDLRAAAEDQRATGKWLQFTGSERAGRYPSVKPSAQPTLVRTQHLPPRKNPGHKPCLRAGSGKEGAVHHTVG